MDSYNLFAQVQREVDTFENDTILIAGVEGEGMAKYLKGKNRGYQFSQKKTLDLIDLYDNSKFESGHTDTQGQRKLFLNIGTFRREVASKQIRLGVKDYVFIPDDYPSIWKTWFMQRRFKVWARDNLQGELINELEENFPKYGSIVTKKVGKKVERVPLKTLVNPQDARSLKEAALSGRFVIQKHELTKYELKKFKDWKVNDTAVKFDNVADKKLFYEVYGLVPKSEIKKFEEPGYKSGEGDDEPVFAMAIVSCHKPTGKSAKDTTGHVLYIQEISESDWPYEEEHWNKQDGRWLGVGEMEKQFENQIARNSSVNLRRRAMLYGSKKIWQTASQMVKSNLVKEVADGAVLEVGQNGELKQVDMSTRSLPDFNADDQLWEQNSNQRGFTFEAATGESMPSGTPFRLGVLLSDAVSTHFQQMKEKFGLFLIRSYFNQVIPIFKKDTKEHTIQILGSEEGAEHFIECLRSHYVWTEFKDMLLKGNVPDVEKINNGAMQYLKSIKYHFVDVMRGYYDDAKFHMELDITGQAIDTKTELETMKTVFQTVGSNPGILADPNMMRLLELMVSRTGKTMKEWVGNIKPVAPAVPPGTPVAPGQGNAQTPQPRNTPVQTISQ